MKATTTTTTIRTTITLTTATTTIENGKQIMTKYLQNDKF